MSIPPSLVQYNQRDSTQDGTQSFTTLPLPPIRCTCKPLLFWHHLRPSIPNPRRPLCQQFFVLLLRSSPGCPIQNITTRTHPSQFHGKCWLFLRYCLYLDQTRLREHICSSMPIGIHWIYCPSILSSHCQQGSQYDSLSFRVPHQLHSSRWTPLSWYSMLKTSLS